MVRPRQGTCRSVAVAVSFGQALDAGNTSNGVHVARADVVIVGGGIVALSGRNGVLASLCFPSFPGMAGGFFAKGTDRDLALALAQIVIWHYTIHPLA